MYAISIANIDKERLVRAHENGDDVMELGRMLGITNRKTIYHIIYRYKKSGNITSGHRGGYCQSKINEEIGEKLLVFIDKQYDSTLTEMGIFLKENCGLEVSNTTISKYLKYQFITYKRIIPVVNGRNSEEVKTKRYDYVCRILGENWISSNCIYIDETSIHMWLHSEKGRSKKGEVLAHIVPNNRGPVLSLVMAINKKGVIHWTSVVGSFNHEKYQKFICDLSLKVDHNVQYYMIHDNATIHNRTITTTERHEIVHLPPYSPFLNPIENMFGVLKSKLRKQMTRTPGIINMAPEEKIQTMNRYVADIIADDNFKNFKNYYKKTKNYYLSAMKKEDILV